MNTIAPITLLNMTESETFDFKSGQYKFYGATDDEKAELLKDIIAFANSWKAGDAFIVIGVSEKNGRKDTVVGVTDPLKDNDVQQFVNSKTNRRVSFLVYSDRAEGRDINVIQIARRQERPIFLSKAFGKYKANDVFIRSGSSTTVASPDQIAEMAKADLELSVTQANLDLEWADSEEHRRLGKEVTLGCLKLVEPPPPAPNPLTLLPEVGVPNSIAARMDSIRQVLLAQYATLGTPTMSTGRGPSREELEYTKACALLAPLRIWVKNLGHRNASSVNVRILVPRGKGIHAIDEGDLPKEPQTPLSALASVRIPSFCDTHVEESPEGWNLEIHTKSIQPQDEFWSRSKFYVWSESDQTVETTATIFADDLAKPIEIPLKLTIQVTTREITHADVGFALEESQ